MTNSEAFEEYFNDAGKSFLILTMKGITPALDDRNAESAAWGMIELAKSPNYSQGRTSETLTNSARALLKSDAKQILKDNGVYWNDGSSPSVGSTTW